MALDIAASDHGLIRLDEQARDYDRMAKALDWLALRWRDRPSLEEAADAAGLSPFHFQRVFTRWAGVSPKTFVASIAHAEAQKALAEGASVLDAAYDVGLSGPSRLHDLFITQEAVTPGETLFAVVSRPNTVHGWRPISVKIQPMVIPRYGSGRPQRAAR